MLCLPTAQNYSTSTFWLSPMEGGAATRGGMRCGPVRMPRQKPKVPIVEAGGGGGAKGMASWAQRRHRSRQGNSTIENEQHIVQVRPQPFFQTPKQNKIEVESSPHTVQGWGLLAIVWFCHSLNWASISEFRLATPCPAITSAFQP
jgi:hypothetical protein